MDYMVVVGLFGISVAFFWRVVFVLTRGIERSLEEFKTLTNERFDRQDAAIKEGFARQDERFARQDERFAKQDERFDRLERRLDKQGERLDRQGERLDRQGECLERQGGRLDRQDALILRLVKDVSLLTGALIRKPAEESEQVGSRE